MLDVLKLESLVESAFPIPIHNIYKYVRAWLYGHMGKFFICRVHHGHLSWPDKDFVLIKNGMFIISQGDEGGGDNGGK